MVLLIFYGYGALAAGSSAMSVSTYVGRVLITYTGTRQLIFNSGSSCSPNGNFFEFCPNASFQETLVQANTCVFLVAFDEGERKPNFDFVSCVF